MEKRAFSQLSLFFSWGKEGKLIWCSSSMVSTFNAGLAKYGCEVAEILQPFLKGSPLSPELQGDTYDHSIAFAPCLGCSEHLTVARDKQET